jgi:hypothetical protein
VGGATTPAWCGCGDGFAVSVKRVVCGGRYGSGEPGHVSLAAFCRRGLDRAEHRPRASAAAFDLSVGAVVCGGGCPGSRPRLDRSRPRGGELAGCAGWSRAAPRERGQPLVSEPSPVRRGRRTLRRHVGPTAAWRDSLAPSAGEPPRLGAVRRLPYVHALCRGQRSWPGAHDHEPDWAGRVDNDPARARLETKPITKRLVRVP